MAVIMTGNFWIRQAKTFFNWLFVQKVDIYFKSWNTKLRMYQVLMNIQIGTAQSQIVLMSS